MDDWKPGDVDRRMSNGGEDLGWLKKSVIGSLIALTTHLGAGMWWAATMTAKIDFLQDSLLAIKQDMKEGTSDRYRGADALKDFKIINDRIERNEIRLNRLESKFDDVRRVSA